jgi:glycolate oxidase FAD binding subunit
MTDLPDLSETRVAGAAPASDTSGEAAVRAACDDVRAGGPADHVDGVVPGLVARPRSTAEVAEVLRACAAHGSTVVPRGRGTKLSWGRPPSSADLLLDVSGLDRVLDHAAGDLIVVTQAGARLRDVQETLASAQQQLAVDETVPGATVGGSMCAAATGPRRQVSGTFRDLLIGVTVVRADGVVAKSGGRVVKNVAGYDLGKLMIGSFGTLAVVTETVFRLHPLAEVRRWVVLPVADAAAAHRAVHAVVHSQAVPTAVEVDWPAGGAGVVTALLEGRADGVAGRVRAVRDLLGTAAGVGDQEPEGWSSYPWGEGDTALKLTFVLSGIGDVLATAREVGASVRGSAGTGVLHAAVADPDRAPAAVARLRETCTRHQGSAVVLDGPAAVKDAVDLWGPVPALDLMRRVKDRFDPDHRLSPGRFVGGI